MPAYSAAPTLRKTYDELPHIYVDELILAGDASKDETGKLSGELGMKAIIHQQNKRYGGNQKTCYREALRQGAAIIVIVHPDYQYSPGLLQALPTLSPRDVLGPKVSTIIKYCGIILRRLVLFS